MGALRVQGQHYQTRAPCFFKLADALQNRRFTKTHSTANHRIKPLFLECGSKTRTKTLMDNRKRRTFVGPYLFILSGRSTAPLRQNEQVQNEPPRHTVHRHNSAVHKKLRQVLTHSARSGFDRSTGIHHKHAASIFHRHDVYHLPGIETVRNGWVSLLKNLI